MKITIALTVLIFISACGSAPKVAEKPVTNTRNQTKRVADTVASHTVEGERDRKLQSNTAVPVAPKEGKKRKWSRSGDPIDTSTFDAEVSKAAAALKAKPDDETARKALGKAHFERGVALTAARQYASAIGDFRKAVENDSGHAEAKQQIALITSIYNSMNIEVPGKGEEPAPLEFEK